MLEGTGRIRIGDELHTLAPLSSAYIEPEVVRQVFNDTEPMRFGSSPARPRSPRTRSR